MGANPASPESACTLINCVFGSVAAATASAASTAEPRGSVRVNHIACSDCISLSFAFTLAVRHLTQFTLFTLTSYM